MIPLIGTVGKRSSHPPFIQVTHDHVYQTSPRIGVQPTARYCYYCGERMSLADGAAFAAQHQTALRHARQRRCTAEHLVARRDGGRDAPSNKE
jgi:hypothetical protein